MKKTSTKITLLICLLSCFFNAQKVHAQTYDALNISLLGHFNDTTYVANNWTNSKYAGCWGWYNSVDGKEYAIVGGSNGTYFIEITNPATPLVRGYVPGIQVNCVWREIKTYQNYCYIVSDDPLPNGFQIVDMSYLPDSVHVVHSGNSIIEQCHTIFVDGNKLYGGFLRGGVVGVHASMAVFSLTNPSSPALIRTLDQDDPTHYIVHDMFVRNDTVYASCATDGLFMYKFNSNNTFSPISNLTFYPEQGYNHAGSLTDDGNTFIFMDEVPTGLAIKSLDVSDITNPTVVATFRSSIGDTPHNPFVIGNNYVVCANYQDGIQIYDIIDPVNPVRTGYFDTHWQTTISDTAWGYVGCWGAYPYLPSHNVIAIDMQNGLYVLNANSALGIPQNLPAVQNSMNVYYNGNTGNFNVMINSAVKQRIAIQLVDMLGQVVYSAENSFIAGSTPLTIGAGRLANGIYTLNLKGENFSFAKKVCKVK